MSHRITRRHFVFGTAAAGLAAWRPGRALAQEQKLRLGIIGVGGQGEYNWGNVAHEEIVALCDVDLARTARAAAQFPGAMVTQDFRRVLDRKDVDAVLISTPDHWHAIIANWAMEAGKHVYCEKPLAHSVHETRQLIETARRTRRVTQMGTQIHAGGNYRRVVELVRSGLLGDISRVDVWCEKQPSPGRIAAAGTPPASLDYDMWLGPAPWRAYDPGVLPFNWRWWWEFGGGVLADMACHFMDLPFWALELGAPRRVSASGTLFPSADNHVPVTMKVDYHFPRRDDRGPVHLVWWHGTPGPVGEDGKAPPPHGYRNGVLFHGEHGQLLADYGAHKLLPEDKFTGVARPTPTIPDSIGHHREWLRAIREGGTTTCAFDYSGRLTEAVLLGNVAFRLGREIEWDSKRGRVKGGSEREWKPLLRREYRGDWKLKP